MLSAYRVFNLSKRSVPLLEKEGLGEICLDKSPSIPLFKGGGERLLVEQELVVRNVYEIT